MNRVKIYTSDRCIQCKQAKEYLKNKDINFIEYDISKNQEYKRELIKKGYLSVPVIVVNDQDILGFDLPRINKLLNIK